jgi:hypothetical protein
MEQGPPDVRQDIENTRAAMTEKLEMLEERARETVEGAKSAVQHTVDVHYQVDQHPWKMVGASVLVGYLLGRVTSGGSASSRIDGQRILILDTPVVRGTYSTSPKRIEQYTSSRSEVQEPGFSGGILEQYRDELAIIKGAVVGAVVHEVVGVVRDLIKQAVPTLTSHLKKTSSTPSGVNPDDETTSLRTG